MYGRPPHTILSTFEYPNGRIERRKGSWTYYTAYPNDRPQCNFARKRDAIAYMERSSNAA